MLIASGSTSIAQRSTVRAAAATRAAPAPRRRGSVAAPAAGRLHQHLHALDVGDARRQQRHRGVDARALGAGQAGAAGQRPAGRPAPARPRHRRWQSIARCAWAATRRPRAPQLAGREGGEVVPAQSRRRAGAAGAGLRPHLPRPRHARPSAGAANTPASAARTGARGAEVAAERALSGFIAATRVMRRKSCPLVTICVPTSVDLAGVHRARLRFQRALQPRAVGVDAGDARQRTVGQQRCRSALPGVRCRGRSVRCRVAAVRAGARHYSVKPQWWQRSDAVQLVEYAPGAAMRTAALPAAIGAVQHRCVAAAVQQQRALPALDALADRRLQPAPPAPTPPRVRGGCWCHVDQAHARQIRPPMREGERQGGQPSLSALPGSPATASPSPAPPAPVRGKRGGPRSRAE